MEEIMAAGDTGSPGVCAAWCGGTADWAKQPVDAWYVIGDSVAAYCSEACRDAGKPLNPSPSTTVAMGPLDEFRAAYRDVGNVGPGPWTASQMRRFWKAAEVLAACGGVLTLGVTSPSAGQEAAKPRGSDEGAAGKVPASPAIPRAREVAANIVGPIPGDWDTTHIDRAETEILARDAAIRAAALEEAAKVADERCNAKVCHQDAAARIRSLKGSGT